MLQLTINGEARQFDDVVTVADLIRVLALTGKRVAVERNGAIVPRSRHGETPLRDCDTLEIVVAVGGG
ncbi:sulfur carrier protein ThiS [Paludibacterium sp.]|uniref:sulfur carrier protein ThiS n=1 Tax=Paludibacterium sp. TaxID=1917523 RepID=UPI0025D85A47|nr:sulfur carrier protein ThiS [Paludibacterium sp.]MBV8648854.1 sulfur carrier protein ThiS [Paludibacterium sp.]